MADSFGNRVIVVDLTAITKRLIRADMVEICAVVVDGVGPAAGATSAIVLKEGGTGGNPIWMYNSTGATQQHVADYVETKVSKGLYIARDTDADFTIWTGPATMYIYTK